MRGELARFLPMLIVAGVAAIAVRTLLGFHFPVPWPDETQFISPAYNLIHDGSMFDPGLDPDRVSMGMPPGYSVLLSGVFALFGYSYAVARWVSTVAFLAMLVAVGRTTWMLTAGVTRTLAGLLVGIAFLSPYVLIDSNLARMELVLGTLIALALLCGVSGRLWAMAALVGGSAVIHFNAVWFVPGVVLAFGQAAVSRRFVWPTWLEGILFATALGSVVAYVVYGARHWPGLLEDMRYQFHVHAVAAAYDRDHTLWMAVLACGLACLRILLSRGVDRATLVGLFGAGFVTMAHAGHEMWYDDGEPIGFALLGVSFLAGAPARRAPTRIVTAVCVFVTLFASFRVTALMREMLPRPAMLRQSFLSADERRDIRTTLATLHRGDTVNFGMSGVESFYLPELRQKGAHWIMAAHALSRVTPFRSATVRIACDSPALPPVQRILEWDLPRSYQGQRCYVTR